MIIEDIKLIERNDIPKSAPYHYSRVFRITTENGVLYTPNKSTNRLEYNARSGVPLLKALPSEVTSNFKLLDSKQISSFMNNDKNAIKIVNIIKQFNDITRRSALRISVFQPTSDVLSVWDKNSKIRFAEYQAEYLQSRLGSNLISYPFLDLSASDYIEFIDEHYVRDEHQSTIFTLDLGMDPTHLKKILEYLKAKDDPMIIAVIYRPWDRTIPQHIILNEYFENEKMLFFACQVERRDLAYNTSNTHAVTIGANFDIVALKQSRGFPIEQDLDLNKILFYSPSSLTLDTIENTLQNPQRDLIREFEIPHYNYLDLIQLHRIIKGYRGAKVHPKKYQILFYLARVHEAMTSPKMFANTQQRILQKTIPEHIRETGLRFIPMIRGF